MITDAEDTVHVAEVVWVTTVEVSIKATLCSSSSPLGVVSLK